MANKRDPNKQRIEIWLDKKAVFQLDAEAQRMGRSRSDIIVKAIREHLKLDPIPSSAAQIDELKNAMMRMAIEQAEIKNGIKSDNDAIMRAIRETAPAPALPEPGRKLTWGERIRGKLD